jgi:methyltransferase-like protein/SAM-dependent methyltransferase
MAHSASQQPISYDLIPYKSHPFPQSHPDRLATIATLFGLQPPRIESCRVLELGCASGGNLLPMADQFPEGRFVGIDASSRQIEDGQKILALSKLSNVELRCQNILDFADDEPFDYIICHGVYSWVPEAVQRRILDICRRCLTSNGVAYVSYNTYPGWHMRGMIRDIMRYRARRFDDPRSKLNQARGLLTFLGNSVKGEDNPYGLLLRQELESISRADDSYLLHEHLEDINEPIYFHEFADRAKTAGLQYLGEADFGVMSVENFPEQVQGMLLSVSGDAIETEQYMDFLRNRAFRQTLLVRNEVSFERTPSAKSLLRLQVASSARPEAQTVDMRPSEKVSFRRGVSSLRTSDPVVKAAILHLANVWPLTVPFGELAALGRSIASGRPAAVDSDLMGSATEQFANTLIRCFATSTIDLRSVASRFVTSVSERPRTGVLARVQASQGIGVTNRLHELVPLDEIQRRIVAACDGTRTPADLIENLGQALTRNEIILHHDGRKVTDPEMLPKLVGDLVPQILDLLASRGMLVA